MYIAIYILTDISGCIVAIFTHWLRHRNDKKDDK
ncbi:type I toxin-antitoxin system Fst family toxin [Pseudomonas aeruginosa]|nr:type I toxin-antitoxin system Fst family toxin [Pseudomonas aeruginosa]